MNQVKSPPLALLLSLPRRKEISQVHRSLNESGQGGICAQRIKCWRTDSDAPVHPFARAEGKGICNNYALAYHRGNYSFFSHANSRDLEYRGGVRIRDSPGREKKFIRYKKKKNSKFQNDNLIVFYLILWITNAHHRPEPMHYFILFFLF